MQPKIVLEDREVSYEEVLASPLEDKIAELDAQLRSISSWAEKVAMECRQLRQAFLQSSRRAVEDEHRY